MIQRIQTIYFLLASLISGVLSFFVDIWETNNQGLLLADLWSKEGFELKTVPLLFIVSTVVTFFAIFKFKNRRLQLNLGRMAILINLILLGLFIYLLLTLSGEALVSKKDIGMFLPLVTIVFVFLANKAVKKDEDLVKSVDRLR